MSRRRPTRRLSCWRRTQTVSQELACSTRARSTSRGRGRALAPCRVSASDGRARLACPAAAPQRALLRDSTALAVVDLQAGATLSRHAWAGPGGAWEARSACADPQQPEVAAGGRTGKPAHALRLPAARGPGRSGPRDAPRERLPPRGRAAPQLLHVARALQGHRTVGPPTRLHQRAGLSLSPHGARSAPCERARCSGNAPDFDFQGGILAAVSGGAAGTQLGAKVHVSARSPQPQRRMHAPRSSATERRIGWVARAVSECPAAPLACSPTRSA